MDSVPESRPRPLFFSEDVVCLKTNPSVLGFISKVAGESDSEDEYEEDEDDEEELEPGEASVCWLKKPEEETEDLAELELVDRSFLHGDIVAKAEDALGQTGTVVGVNMDVDLEGLDGKRMLNVNSERLQHIRRFRPGNYVVNGMWLGRVEDVTDDVTVTFDDGTKCRVMHASVERLVPVVELATDDENDCPYYPGQRVRGSTSSVFKNAKYLRGSWKPNRTEGTVMRVEPAAVTVYWLVSGKAWGAEEGALGNHGDGPPPESIEGKNLFPLNYFLKTSWQIGDHCLLKPESTSIAEVDATEDPPTQEGPSPEAPRRSEAEEGSPPQPSTSAAANGSAAAEVAQQQPLNRRKKKREKKKERKRAAKLPAEVPAGLQVVATRTSVDVLWQDGTKSCGVRSVELVPVDHLGDHDFWPEEFVIEAPQHDDTGAVVPGQALKQGVVRRIDAKEMTAVVRWFTMDSDVAKPLVLGQEEEVSVYELSEHPDYSYRLGDVVIRLSGSDRSAAVQALKGGERRGEHADVAAAADKGAVTTEESGTEESEWEEETEEGEVGHRASKELMTGDWAKKLSWVGEIAGLRGGFIDVAWGDGTRSSVGPHAVYVVSNDDDGGGEEQDEEEEGETEEDHDDDDDDQSWETMSVNMEELAAEEDQGEMRWQNEEEEGVAEREAYASWEERRAASRGADRGAGGEPAPAQPAEKPPPQSEAATEAPEARGPGWAAALPRLLTRLASNLIGGSGNTQELQQYGLSVSGGKEPSSGLGLVVHGGREQTAGILGPTRGHDAKELVDEALREGSTREGKSGTASGASVSAESVVAVEGGEIGGGDSAEAEGAGRELAALQHLECLPECPQDHHYLGKADQVPSQRQWMRKVQKEWEMLGTSLPEFIYVHVYENRMDLMRAVIVGAAGTPYHDGLFFFDFHLPPEYPAAPPVTYYISGGLRLNPNLYAEGKVCLSLLNTWTGKGSEVWHPESSNMLQVLVSIQGLVLVDKPYFNEAGYEKQVGTGEGEKNSLLYNENAFLLSCKSMLYLLRRPPQHFEKLVKLHFQQRGAHILRCCDAYLAGARVGSLPAFGKDLAVQDQSNQASQDKCSGGFRLVLAKLKPKLETAFKETCAVT